MCVIERGVRGSVRLSQGFTFLARVSRHVGTGVQRLGEELMQPACRSGAGHGTLVPCQDIATGAC